MLRHVKTNTFTEGYFSNLHFRKDYDENRYVNLPLILCDLFQLIKSIDVMLFSCVLPST